VGEDLQKLVMGADEYGHSILSRFLALHAGVLPGLLIVLLVAHIYFFRRHGIHAHKPDPHLETTFWPDQILKDAVASLAVLAVVLLLVTWGGFTGDHTGQSPGEYLGADLGSPADPASLYEARPEWYFLFLFQFLKFFPGETEVIGAIVIPGVVFGLLFLMPLTGRWKLGHRLNVAFVLLLLVGAVGLTGMSLYEDRNGTTEESRKYLKAVAEADVIAERVVELAQGPEKIPPAGALELLRNDPLIQGPRLFERDCLSCHEHTDREGNGIARPETKDADPDALTGADLYNFASRPWIAGLLDPQQIAGPRYFQHTTHVEGEMISYVQDELSEMEADDVKAIVAALSAEAKLPYQAEQDREDADLIETGRSLIVDNCTGCHKFRDDGEIIGEYPDLTGYGSRKWIMGMIKDPTHERYYGDSNDRMPSFAEDEENPDRNRLTQREIRLLADWLRNDWYRAEAADAEDAGEQAANDQDDTGQDAGEQDAADETPTEKTPTDEASAAQETDTPDPEAGTSDGTEESGETSVEPADGVSDGSEPDATEPDSSESDTAADTEPPQ
jgi:ubiquinol-cytochrome c reductase cytochrome b subunit